MSLEYLTADEINYLHHRIVALTGGAPGARDISLVQILTTRLRVCHSGREAFGDVFEKAAEVLTTIVTQRPFHDGNKRTAIAASALFLRLNGKDLLADDEAIVDLLVGLEKGDVAIREIQGWFERYTLAA